MKPPQLGVGHREVQIPAAILGASDERQPEVLAIASHPETLAKPAVAQAVALDFLAIRQLASGGELKDFPALAAGDVENPEFPAPLVLRVQRHRVPVAVAVAVAVAVDGEDLPVDRDACHDETLSCLRLKLYCFN